MTTLNLKKNGNVQQQYPTFFDELFNRILFNWGTLNYSDTNTTIPAVNIKEMPDNYEVEVAAPGMSKKDFKIQLDGNILTISSEKSAQFEEGEKGFYRRREFSYQSFSRNFNLQKDVIDTEKIEAGYQDGVLHLIIPKMEKAKEKQPRLIDIA